MEKRVDWTILAILIGLTHLPEVQLLGQVLVPGDVYIQAVASGYRSADSHGCTDIDTESVQNLMAVQWSIELINTQYSSQHLRIGLEVVFTCGSVELTELTALNLARQLSNRSNIVGVIGVDSSSETEVMSRLLSALPPRYRLPQISYSATSVILRNRNIYRNLFRVIPADDIQVKAMVKLLEQLKWNYISVLYEDNDYGKGGLEALRALIVRKGKRLQLCIPVTIAITPGVYGNVYEELRDKFFFSSPPQQGIIVFGTVALMQSVMSNIELLLNKTSNMTKPVFLFSETGSILTGTQFKVSKGAFVMSPRRTPVLAYENWFLQKLHDLQTAATNSDNIWLKETYYKFLLKTPGGTNPTLTVADLGPHVNPSVYSQYAIQAALVLVRAVYGRHKQLCNSTNQICQSFLDDPRDKLVDVLDNITVHFDQDFRMIDIPEFRNPDIVVSFNHSIDVLTPSQQTQYEVYNIQNCSVDISANCLQRVGNYSTSESLQVNLNAIRDYDKEGNYMAWPGIRKAQCPVGYVCESCLASKDAHLFIQGDMYVVGIVPVHNQGDTPLQCGKIKLGGLDMLEAIRFVVNSTTSFRGKKVGLIIIDSCNDPQVVQEKVLTLNRLGVLVDGVYMPVRDKILGYVGGWSSDITKGTAEITTRLKYLQISYASTATFLSKRTLYPYLLRVTSTDNVQAEAMVNMIEELHSNMFQMLYSESAYGEGGRAEVTRLANEKKLCLVNEIAVTRKTLVTYLVNSLRQFSAANIVLVFVSSFDLEYIMNDVNTILHRNEFLFISSDGWGTRFHADGLTNLVGSITMSARLDLNEKFTDHLKSLSAETEEHNFWLTEYMESHFKCFFEWSYNKTTSSQCKGNEALTIDNGYIIDAWEPFAEMATLALLYGTRYGIDTYCSKETTVCPAMRDNIQQIVSYLYETFRSRSSSDQFGVERVFNDNGDGLTGFQTFILNDVYKYEKVTDGKLLEQLQAKRGRVVNSTCDNQAYCDSCFALNPQPLKPESEYISVGIIAVIAILCIVCCVLLAILMFVCIRHGCCITFERGRPRIASTYLTPIYVKEHSRAQKPEPFENTYNDLAEVNRSSNVVALGHPTYCSDASGNQNGSHSASSQQYNSSNRPLPTPQELLHPSSGQIMYNADGSYITMSAGHPAASTENPTSDSASSGEDRPASATNSQGSGYIAQISSEHASFP